MSRTSARQQRMRQQTLDEERMAQVQIEPKGSGERPSASKLIINSPTLTHPSLNVNMAGPTSTQYSENSRVVNQCNRNSNSSTLLATLGGVQRQDTGTIGNSGLLQQSRLYISTGMSEQNLNQTASSNASKSSDNTRRPNFSDSSRDTINTMYYNQSVQQQSQSNQRNPPCVGRPQNLHFKCENNESVSPGIASTSEISTLELEAHDFPTPSDINSPMESCFANIMEDQGSDSFDLNNITPSLHLSSSVGMSNSTLDYSQPTVETNMQESGIQITSNLSAHPKRDLRMERDEDMIHASSSCPAGMPDGIQHNQLDGSSSPLQSNSHLAQSILNTRGGGGGSPLGVAIPEPASLPVGHAPIAVINIPSANRSMDDQRVAWIRDRTKKDSHNRIERKRRDYINCQIAELGNLLPEDMFRDGDSKKNKGSVLKNSVEFICFLRSELAQVPEVRRETSLAAKVIAQLVKRVQELESVNTVLTNNTQQPNRINNADYQSLLQEWLMLHENNLQASNSISLSSSLSRQNFYQNTDTAGSSSPGLSSVGTEDLVGMDTKSILTTSLPTPVVGSAPAPSNPLANSSRINSPISNAASLSKPTGDGDSSIRLMRTRCTSLSVSTTGANKTADVNATVPRLNTSELQTQSNKLRLQRALQSHQSAQIRLLHSTANLSQQNPTQSSQQQQQQQQSQLRNSLLPVRQTQQSFPTSQSSAPITQQQLTGQYHNNNNNQLSCVVGGMITDQSDYNSGGGCLSASLPVNVNPFLYSLQDHDLTDEKLGQTHPFNPNSLITNLKTEPQFELDSKSAVNSQQHPIQTLRLDSIHGGQNAVLELVTQFDPLIASVMHSHSSVQHQSGTVSVASSSRSKMYEPVSSMNFDSPTNIANLDVDDFQFEDVPME